MIKIKEAIVVEGRYDKNTLAQIVDAPIFQTDGFGIFKNKEQMALLRAAAIQRGLIILTDSDGAGFVIRNHLKGSIPAQYLKHAYIPDIFGKEKRKSAPGKEGKLGVEGMTPEVLMDALKKAGATFPDGSEPSSSAITKGDLFDLGLTGAADSSRRRAMLMKKLNLPEHMSTNALLQALNILVTPEQLAALLEE